jgi:hypothetical protein
MIDLEQKVEMIWNGNNKNHYENKGYIFTKYNDKFYVKAKDLSITSTRKVNVKCDYCDKYFLKGYGDYKKNISIIKKDACKLCGHLKKVESNILKYGTIAPNSSRKTLNEIINEFKERNYEFISCDFKHFNHKIPIYYRCNKHLNNVQHMTYDDFLHNNHCKYCGIEMMANKRRTPYEKVVKIFEEHNCKLLSKEYTGVKQILEYICLNHSDIIQYTTFGNFTTSPNCKYCHYDSIKGNGSYNWKGGVSSLRSYLTTKAIKSWKKSTMKICNYKCVISGDRFDDIHHLYSFDQILKEVLEITKFEVKTMGEYTKEEIDLLTSVCINLHKKYGNGVCLRSDIHTLFHHEYLYGNNTKEQFEEFRQRYLAGEFSDVV